MALFRCGAEVSASLTPSILSNISDGGSASDYKDVTVTLTKPKNTFMFSSSYDGQRQYRASGTGVTELLGNTSESGWAGGFVIFEVEGTVGDTVTVRIGNTNARYRGWLVQLN